MLSKKSVIFAATAATAVTAQTHKECLENFKATGKCTGASGTLGTCVEEPWLKAWGGIANVCVQASGWGVTGDMTTDGSWGDTEGTAAMSKFFVGKGYKQGKNPEHTKYVGLQDAFAVSTDHSKAPNYPTYFEPTQNAIQKVDVCKDAKCMNNLYVQTFANNDCSAAEGYGTLYEPGSFTLVDGLCYVASQNQWLYGDPDKRTIRTPVYYAMKVDATNNKYTIKGSTQGCADALDHSAGASGAQSETTASLDGRCSTKKNLGRRLKALSRKLAASRLRELAGGDEGKMKSPVFRGAVESMLEMQLGIADAMGANRIYNEDEKRMLKELDEEEAKMTDEQKRKLDAHTAATDVFSFYVKLRVPPNSCTDAAARDATNKSHKDCYDYFKANNKCDGGCALSSYYKNYNIDICLSQTDGPLKGGKHPGHLKYVGPAAAKGLNEDHTNSTMVYPTAWAKKEVACSTDVRYDRFHSKPDCSDLTAGQMSTAYEPSDAVFLTDMCTVVQMNAHFAEDPEKRTLKRPVYFYYKRQTQKSFFFASSEVSCEDAKIEAVGEENNDKRQPKLINWQTQTQTIRYENGICQLLSAADPCDTDFRAQFVRLSQEQTGCVDDETSGANSIAVLFSTVVALVMAAFLA